MPTFCTFYMWGIITGASVAPSTSKSAGASPAVTRVGWRRGWCARARESRQPQGQTGRDSTDGSELDSDERAALLQAVHSWRGRQLPVDAR